MVGGRGAESWRADVGQGWSFWLEAGQGSRGAVRCPCVKRRGQVRKKQVYVSVRETQTGPEVS